MACFLCVSALFSSLAFAKKTFTKPIAEGVTYIHEIRSVPPLHIHVIKADLLNFRLSLRPLLAWDRIGRIEKLSLIAKRYGAIAGINGSFFSQQSQHWYPVGYIMIDSKLIYKSDIHRPSFCVTSRREVIIDYFKPKLFLRRGEQEKLSIHFINRPAPQEGITLYTAHYGLWNGAPLSSQSVLLNRKGSIYTIMRIAQGPRSFLPQQRLLSFVGKSRSFTKELKVGSSFSIDEYIAPRFSNVVHLLTGGPTLLRNGKIVKNYKQEGFYGAFLARQPRSAIGVTEDNIVLFVVVDGRQSGYSVGVTFPELSRVLLSYGALDAMGLDSGGSSTLYAQGKVLNHPSEGVARPVANGWFLFQDKYLY